MLTSLNGAGESGTVPAMNNPQVMAAMIGEINSFINFKLLTDSISPALSGEQVHYVVNSLSGVSQTADLENKRAQELSFAGVEGRLRITMLEKLESLYGDIDANVRENLKARLRQTNKTERGADLVENVLRKFIYRISLVKEDLISKLEMQGFETNEYTQALELVASVAVNAEELPYLIDGTSHEHTIMKASTDNIKRYKPASEWEKKALSKIYNLKHAPLAASFVAYDYLRAVLNGYELDLSEYDLTSSSKGPNNINACRNIGHIRREAMRYLLVYANAKSPGEVYNRTMLDYWDAVSCTSRFTNKEDDSLLELVNKVRSSKIDEAEALALQILSTRDRNAQYHKLGEAYNEAVNTRQHRRAENIVRVINDNSIDLINDPVEYTSERGMPVVLPFGKNVVTKILGLLPNARWLDSLRQRLKVA